MISSRRKADLRFELTPRLGRHRNTELKKLSIIVPVYNERLTLCSSLKRVRGVTMPLDVEYVLVDDGSTDGSGELVRKIAEESADVIAIRHDKNRGKGAAIRTAIAHMTGDVAVIQDADLEYDPNDIPRLLRPILEGRADAVFGSRFCGESRRVMMFWHTLANKVLTVASNMVNDLNLTDMETCYKLIRADVLRNLNLSANSFNIEPEITARLSQWRARIFEMPISYDGRSYEEGKKIGAKDAVIALWEIIRTGLLNRRFTNHAGFYILSAVSRARKYNKWTLQKMKRFLGKRLLEAGSGIGSMSCLLLRRERLVMVDYEPLYVSRLERQYGHLDNVSVCQGDLTDSRDFDQWEKERLDTIFSSNVIEHLVDDQQVLKDFHRVLQAAGHCVIVVPAGERLYTGVDAALGHHRRYTRESLAEKMEDAGFEVVHQERFNKLGALGWFVSGKIFRRRHVSPNQMIWFDRLLWLAKFLDWVLPIKGMSLIMVGKKRDTSVLNN